jgi:hypothetical protein
VTRFHGHKKLPIVFFPFILIGIAGAASPDSRILSLVPPGAQLVAGISASSIRDQPDNFVLMTHNNRVDLQDFFALIGADSSSTIHQILLVAMANKEGQPNEHSLLASGHFDQPHVFKSAADRGAALTIYRRIPVLEIQPFAREHNTFKDVRWLAVLDSSVLVFGTVASARLELDRHLAQNHPEESLLLRLARLRSKDQTWCLLSASSRIFPSLTRGHEIQDVLDKLSPELAELAKSGSELEFGFHYGRRVEFDYEVTLASPETSRDGADSLRPAPVEQPMRVSLLPTLDTARDANTLHGVIQISISHYNTWLASISGERFPVD